MQKQDEKYFLMLFKYILLAKRKWKQMEYVILIPKSIKLAITYNNFIANL